MTQIGLGKSLPDRPSPSDRPSASNRLSPSNRLGPPDRLGPLGDLERIVTRSIEEARARGRDHLTQTEHAVRQVLSIRHDLTAPDALTLVTMIRNSV